MLYYDGRHYDLRVRDFAEDLPFWQEQVRRYGDPVLELACGTGRIAITLAEAGFSVTGLDVSESMLEEARHKAQMRGASVTWIRGDCRNFEIGEEFSLIIIGFNSMSHLLTQEDLESCFARVRRHLQPDGRFIVDVFNPDLRILLRDPSKRYPHSEYEDPDGAGTVTITESNVYDRASQISNIRLYYELPDGREETSGLPLRIFFPRELDALLRYNGFRVVHKYGNFDGSPFCSESPKQIAVCQPNPFRIPSAEVKTG